ncbi:hypothetical protein PoB_004533300 [Plakobranchus ocellatus]|uniref:Uncharacterized protein n=1 Tax=Plakobranchus ocellatus TaxID=259542 RepID=A0AAV4BI22_9GAST|nr:hypothetical protein PoB_004533300 [Plakobranchus ocellatus]
MMLEGKHECWSHSLDCILQVRTIVATMLRMKIWRRPLGSLEAAIVSTIVLSDKLFQARDAVPGESSFSLSNCKNSSASALPPWPHHQRRGKNLKKCTRCATGPSNFSQKTNTKFVRPHHLFLGPCQNHSTGTTRVDEEEVDKEKDGRRTQVRVTAEIIVPEGMEETRCHRPEATQRMKICGTDEDNDVYLATIHIE